MFGDAGDLGLLQAEPVVGKLREGTQRYAGGSDSCETRWTCVRALVMPVPRLQKSLIIENTALVGCFGYKITMIGVALVELPRDVTISIRLVPTRLLGVTSTDREAEEHIEYGA